MKSTVIAVERELEEQLYATAREVLGADATDADVQALADREYYGPQLPDREETPEERDEWETDLERERALVRQWGLPKP